MSTKSKVLTLRPYQQEAIDIIEGCVVFGDDNIVLKAETSYGKSSVIAGLCEKFNDKHIIILVSIEPLIDQIAYFLDGLNIDYSILKAGRENEFNTHTRVQLVMSQTYYARADKLKIKADILIQDECFTPDVEILTEKGFQRFDQLNKDIKVAQIEPTTMNISFIDPLRYIERDHNGPIYHYISKRNIDISVTENHDMLYFVNNIPYKRKAKELMGFSNHKKIRVAGNGTGNNDHLTLDEKIAIAFQADGNLHSEYTGRFKNTKHKGTKTLLFSFSKERKIKVFKNEFNNIIHELKPQKAYENTKKRKRFILTTDAKISKNLNDIFDIKTFSKNKAIEFIEFMVHWDGSVINNNKYYYSSKEKYNTDLIQAIATLAGYRSIKSVQKDDRKSSYSDIHRLWIHKDTNEISTQCLYKNKPKKEYYSGKVYCVEVPTGSIIVRRNGKITITGNCHKEYNTERTKKIINNLKPDVRIGLSATPWDMAGYKLAHTQIIETASCEYLTKEGYLSPIKYYIPRWSEKLDYSSVAKSGTDYTLSSLDEIIASPKHIQKLIDAMNELNAKNKKTLIFCSTIEQCNRIEAALIKEGYSAAAYHSEKSKKENERIMNSFKMNGTFVGTDEELESRNLYEDTEPIQTGSIIKCLISVSKLTTGFSVDDIDLGVVARPTKVKSLWHQIAGRVRRKADILNKWVENLKSANDLDKRIAMIVSIYNEDAEVKRQLEAMKIKNIDVFEYGTKHSSLNAYDIIIDNVRPNKTHGEILDLGQCITNHGFPEEPYEPPEFTGYSVLDKKNIQEATKNLKLEHLQAVIEDDKPELITREKYNLKIEKIQRNAKKLTNLTLRELSNKLEISTDPTELIAITAVLFDKIYSDDNQQDNYGRQARGYTSNKGKAVVNFLNPNSIEWISEQWVSALEKEEEYYQQKYIKSLRTRCKNLLKEKGSIWSLRFFIEWLLEEDKIEKEIANNSNDSESENNNEYEIEYEYTIPKIEINEDEIPF